MSNRKLIPEPTLANLRLSVEILAQLNHIIDGPSFSGQSNVEINASVDEFAASASQNGNLQKLELFVGGQRIELLVTVHPADGGESLSQAQPNSLPSIPLVKGISPTDIYADLEQAFKDYHSLARLGQNPLLQFIKRELVSTERVSDVRHEPDHPGWLLRRLLDEVVLQICGVPADKTIPKSEWHADHYLHLRYRQRLAHKDLADPLGFSERHLQRHRQQQIRQAAALCVGGGEA